MEAVGGDLEDLDQLEAAAVVAHDLERLMELWDDEFIVNNPFNMVVDRAQVLELVRGGQIAYRSFDRTVEAVRVLGGAAITMGQETVVPDEGAPLQGQTVTRRYTHVWIRREDRWRLVARQASIVGGATS